jgi:hypothetical protein
MIIFDFMIKLNNSLESKQIKKQTVKQRREGITPVNQVNHTLLLF